VRFLINKNRTYRTPALCPVPRHAVHVNARFSGAVGILVVLPLSLSIEVRLVLALVSKRITVLSSGDG
jgi:hypothetical protein